MRKRLDGVDGITTAMFLAIGELAQNNSSLVRRSRSGGGKADFGANRGHGAPVVRHTVNILTFELSTPDSRGGWRDIFESSHYMACRKYAQVTRGPNWSYKILESPAVRSHGTVGGRPYAVLRSRKASAGSVSDRFFYSSLSSLSHPFGEENISIFGEAYSLAAP